MVIYKDITKIRENAAFILFDLAEAKPGDNVVIITDSEAYSNARALCDCAKEHGVHCFIVDVDSYGGPEGYDNIPIMEPLRQAILHADITFMTTPQIKTGFSTYLGSQDVGDESLLGKSKRFTLEAGGMEAWDLNRAEILRNRSRALALHKWLQRAKEIHITTKRGTDLICRIGDDVDASYPVMGIIPFYSEVAIVPKIGTANGVVVSDGASERTYNQRCFPIRPNIPGYRELNREPMKMVYENSVLVEYSGDPLQVERFDTLMEKVNPKPNLCDELGLVTTTSAENNIYGWKVDESHQRHCVHVAIGNNSNRKEIIHSTEHVDFDVHNPVVKVDGKVIYDGKKFNDELIFSMAD